MSERHVTTAADEIPPERSEYWERLAGRIEAAAADRAARPELAWLGANGVRVGGIGVMAAALLLAWVLTRPALARAGVTASATTAEWHGSIAPSDSLGRALAVEQPPALGAVILSGSRSAASAGNSRP